MLGIARLGRDYTCKARYGQYYCMVHHTITYYGMIAI